MHVVPVEWSPEHELEKVMLITQDIGQKHALENLANTDGLTGLFNERYFNSILHKKELQKLPFILFYLDLDHFKPVNDTYGHDMGDKLLKEAAKRLQSCIRSNDYAFRIGGDEFSLVVCTEFDESLCCRIKEQIQNRLCAPFDIDGKPCMLVPAADTPPIPGMHLLLMRSVSLQTSVCMQKRNSITCSAV